MVASLLLALNCILVFKLYSWLNLDFMHQLKFVFRNPTEDDTGTAGDEPGAAPDKHPATAARFRGLRRRVLPGQARGERGRRRGGRGPKRGDESL